MTPPRFAIAGTKCRIVFTVPEMFTFSVALISAGGTFQRGAFDAITAALLMSRFGAPCVTVVRSAQRWTASSSATSSAVKSCGGPNFPRSSAMCFSERPQPMMRWPCAMKNSASARPQPRVQPVSAIILAPSRGTTDATCTAGFQFFGGGFFDCHFMPPRFHSSRAAAWLRSLSSSSTPCW